MLNFLLAPRDHGYESAKASVIQSLNLLKCEYLDLYLIHWPGKSKLKCEDPMNREFRKASWEALEEMYEQSMQRLQCHILVITVALLGIIRKVLHLVMFATDLWCSIQKNKASSQHSH